jgi:AraC-like DNA-binding protein
VFNAKAYSAFSATSPLSSTNITRRDRTKNDVQIEILFCGICHSDPRIEDIADALHISSRTLQRRFQDGDSSFQKALEDARHQLARHCLSNSVLELNEAAYLPGYNDSNSFVRAFRTWEGVPPARWGEQQRARAVQ